MSQQCTPLWPPDLCALGVPPWGLHRSFCYGGLTACCGQSGRCGLSLAQLGC